MSYNIAVPTLYPLKKFPSAKIIWEKDSFKVWQLWNGADCKLFIGDYLISTRFLEEHLRNENEFLKWIKSCKKKDLEKVQRTREMLKQAEEDCKFIEELWKAV